MDRLGACVPQRQSKHTAESPHCVNAPLSIRRQHDFRIRIAYECMAFGQQLTPNLTEIINLAVKNDPVSLVRRRHRLMAHWREIKDGEATMTQVQLSVT